jgi:acetyl esterase/lipase
MKLRAMSLGLVLVCGLATLGRAVDEPAPVTLDVWPGPAPGDNGSIGEEKTKTKGGDPKTITSVTNVTKPTITVYRPEPGKASGMAIVVCPGGGYNNLAWDHEGEQVGRWLKSIGVTGVILKYRVPRRSGTPKDQPPPQALMDAQRALSLVRSKASDWGVDPKRVGILGFSAGGHLAGWAATNPDKRAYEPVDAVDKVDCRPDFAVLVYPGGVVKRGTDQLAPEIRVSSQSPPMFFAHAGDDRVSAENSVQMYLALKRAGVPAELHIYATGGHGFGMRPSDKPCATWPKRCEEWLRSQGLLKSAATS